MSSLIIFQKYFILAVKRYSVIQYRDGRWQWSGHSDYTLSEVITRGCIVEPEVVEEGDIIVLRTRNLASQLNVMPRLRFEANNRIVGYEPNNDGNLEIQIRDIDKHDPMQYFGLPSENIEIRESNHERLFISGNSWTYERDNLENYGNIVFTEISVTGDARRHNVECTVHFELPGSSELREWSDYLKNKGHEVIKTYLEEELPWGRFKIAEEAKFPHRFEIGFGHPAITGETKLIRRDDRARCIFTFRL